MAIFKLHKGLDIRLNGVAATKKAQSKEVIPTDWFQTTLVG